MLQWNKHKHLLVGLLVVISLISSCTNYDRHRGVENTWRNVDGSEFKPGETSQLDVAQYLGPPSQIIDLKQGTVFYYLSEKTTGNGVILILFNSLNEKITYDRAVFFFDKDGILTEYSFSKEAIRE